ncbi:hypothetical protein MG293_014005 [Ovis ammon polii]|uniref:Uncharacterized protein n=1 Tax=Ovis ammon polii TaxID=230172 RepID=A0AAD4Y5V1_OVIAM|nr:hypothetical protein MG293_014005 [Ovis ammon polii]
MSDSCFLRVYSLRDKTNREISQRKIRALELTLTGAAAKHVTWGDARQAIPLPRAVRTTATCTAFNTGREWPSDCLLSSKCKVHNGGDSGAVSVSFVSTYHLVTDWCRVDFTHYPPLSNEWIQQPNSQQFKRPYPPPLPWKMKQRQNESKRLKEHENIRKQMVNRFRTALLGNEKYEIQQNVPVLFSDI